MVPLARDVQAVWVGASAPLFGVVPGQPAPSRAAPAWLWASARDRWGRGSRSLPAASACAEAVLDLFYLGLLVLLSI